MPTIRNGPIPASLHRFYCGLGPGRLRLWRVTLDADAWAPADAPGRWSRAGAPIIYASSAAGLAVLEARAHLDAKDARRTHRLAWLEVEVAAGDAQCLQCDRLPANWKRRKALTRDIGGHWLAQAASVALLVPSALVAGEMNVLLNATHRHWARWRRSADEAAFRFDSRLV
jgi:RES domain-containing protein